MCTMGNEPDRIFPMMIGGARMIKGSGRWLTTGRNLGQLVRLFLGIWLGLVLATGVSSVTADAVPETLYQKASCEDSVRAIVELRAEAMLEGNPAGAEQSSPAPGQGPVPPGSERQAHLRASWRR